MRGDQTEEQFIGFRLKQGVYGQRQADVQMIRVKLPMGGITPDQMDAFADVIEKYVPLVRGHITTRQNIQMHHVPLPDAAKLIRELGDAGLSSREGCGNTVRNVTGDPWAGVCEDELFDPTPYAGAYVRYFVRHPETQLMPRKVKTAFTATDEDRAITGIHDVAYIPRDQGRQARLRGAHRRRHVDHAAHRPDAVRVRRGRQRRLPEGGRGRLPHLQPPGLAAREPRPGAHQGLRRQVRHRRAAQPGRGGAQARLGERARLLGRGQVLRRGRGGDGPGRAGDLRHAQRRHPGLHALRRGQRDPAAPAGLLDRRGQGHARRPEPRAVPRPGPDHARLLGRLRAHDRRPEPGAALGARRDRLRGLEPPQQARPRRRRAPRRSPTW